VLNVAVSECLAVVSHALDGHCPAEAPA
jgi:hypothetical protein